MKRISVIIIFLIILQFLTSGCGTVYKVVVDERSLHAQTIDERITMAIRKKIFDDDHVKFLDISTYCYNGHVYLVGEYEKYAQIRRAVKLAASVEGVKSVTDHFLPKREEDSCGVTDNLELKVEVKAKLIRDKHIWSTNIEVKTIQCNIILLGLVGSYKEVNKAVAYAKSVAGVRSVKSYLKRN